MLDTMRKTVDKSGSLIQQNEGEKVFDDMLYDEYAKKMSKSAGFDLAGNLYKQMAFLQNIPKTAVSAATSSADCRRPQGMAAQHEPRTPARPVAGSRRKTRIGRASAQAATRGFAPDSQAAKPGCRAS